MKSRNYSVYTLALAFILFCIGSEAAQQRKAAPSRLEGPCDIYAAAGDSCVAAHSTARALYASYNGPLYQVMRQSDGKKRNIDVVQASPANAGGYADAASQDAFCANTYCWISIIYDQSPKHNDLVQAPRGGFSGPALGGFNNLPLADMAPITVMNHRVYGVFIAPGMGLRQDDAKGTAVDDQAEGQYWVINGRHFNSGCCFDYGNAEIDSRDDDNGTMETTYFGDATPWYHGNPPGPWVMTDQENNLVGCVNPDGSKLCLNVPNISWRFVTAVAKGESHHWTSMGGDAQAGSLSVMFNGQRINSSYDPMRKQGAILLGNGGDNSNGSQGTFYEGAMTAAGTFPSNATDQLVQANVVAAGYGVQRLSVVPTTSASMPPGLQTFSPKSSQQTTVTFTNSSLEPASGVKLSLTAPKGWTVVSSDSNDSLKTFRETVPSGASVSATFKVTSGSAALNGDLVGKATWMNANTTQTQSEIAFEKVRNVSSIRINEFRISSASPANATDSFIELFNAGFDTVDLSGWTLTERPAQQAIFSTIELPSGTKLPAGRFYLLGLSNSGLVVPAQTGDSTIFTRSTAGMSVGDTITVGTGPQAETRKITGVGTPASDYTTLWQPLPDGPIITIPPGVTNVPVASSAGFEVGEKIALGYGATYPSVGKGLEKYEVATVTAVGKQGTQSYLAAEAAPGATNIKVTSVSDISIGDKIRLDIDSVGHGIETVTVTRVGTRASQTNLSADESAGATRIKVRRTDGFAAGDKITVGTPANLEEATVTSVSGSGAGSAELEITPGLSRAHGRDEWVVSSGIGLDLAAPLQFNHSANLPFSNRGTGISFEPASAFPHSSNEPVHGLGSGITLDRPLSRDHMIHAVVRDTAANNSGYQGTPAPDQWFGGPELTTSFPQFGRTLTAREGSMVLRNSNGMVVDSLNYGGLVDPWAAKGYQAVSGAGHGGCFAPSPGASAGFFGPPIAATTASSGRYTDGADTDSNCGDFNTQASAALAMASSVGTTNIKVSGVAGFYSGQKLQIDSGAEQESAVISSVGTAGGTTASANTTAGATVVPVNSVAGFSNGQAISIDSGTDLESAVIVSIRRFGGSALTVATPLARAHAAGAEVAGTGITFTGSLTRAHAAGAQMTDNAPTPGASNRYSAKRN